MRHDSQPAEQPASARQPLLRLIDGLSGDLGFLPGQVRQAVLQGIFLGDFEAGAESWPTNQQSCFSLWILHPTAPFDRACPGNAAEEEEYPLGAATIVNWLISYGAIPDACCQDIEDRYNRTGHRLKALLKKLARLRIEDYPPEMTEMLQRLSIRPEDLARAAPLLTARLRGWS